MTFPAAYAGIVAHLGHILTAEEGVKILAITEHGQTVGSIAVAEAADEGGLEGPDGVNQPLFFEAAMQIKSLRLGEAVNVGIFRTMPEGFQEGLLEAQHLLGVRPKAKAIPGVRLALIDLAADAGNADDGGGQVHHLGEILQGNHLPEVIPALALL